MAGIFVQVLCFSLAFLHMNGCFKIVHTQERKSTCLGEIQIYSVLKCKAMGSWKDTAGDLQKLHPSSKKNLCCAQHKREVKLGGSPCDECRQQKQML